MFDFNGFDMTGSLNSGSTSFRNAVANAVGNAVSSMLKDFFNTGSTTN